MGFTQQTRQTLHLVQKLRPFFLEGRFVFHLLDDDDQFVHAAIIPLNNPLATQGGARIHGIIAQLRHRYMDEKITIIEGPPPTFELVNEGWVLGLHEGPDIAHMAITRLRTFNGPALVERCYRAWHNQHPIRLEYRTPDGLNRDAPIAAARHVETDDGHLLLLWVCLGGDDVEVEFDDIDDDDTDADEDTSFPDLP